MPNVELNASLFAHILLDSELQGRYGVQGNVFSNTFGYLNQYLDQLPNKPQHVKDLAIAMKALVARETAIGAIGDMARLETFASTNTDAIAALEPGQKLLLPGGWNGIGAPGHAMIYQFEKNPDGELLFSIYNAGAGIGRHEKMSSTDRELYSPVQTYQLPKPIDAQELHALVTRLTIPQLFGAHPARNNRDFDGDTLYNEIDISLAFLKAELVPQNLQVPHITTAGQISGTCTQRSIHQMLKINFGNLPGYQRFIFDFKMHALTEFIRLHPSRNPGLTAFIQKAITNNLRILQEPGVFETQLEQNHAAAKLIELQQQLQQEMNTATKASLTLAPSQPALQANPIQACLSTTIAAFNSSSGSEKNQHPLPGFMPLRQDHLLNDLDDLINQCNNEMSANPSWVLDKIEQAVLLLPLPLTAQQHKPYYHALTFYSAITTKEQFEKIQDQLERLQEKYLKASNGALGDHVVLPNQLAIQASLLTLHDYFGVTGESVMKRPDFHLYINFAWHQVLQAFQGCPFLATDNPMLDQRLIQLTELTKDACQPDYTDEDYLRFYQALSDTEPELKQRLETMYRQQYDHDNSPLHATLRQRQCTALYVLSEEFMRDTSPRQLKRDSPLSTDWFKPLIKKILRQNALEESMAIGVTKFIDGWYDFGPIRFEYKNQLVIHSATHSIRQLRQLAPLEQPKCVAHHKYNLTDSPARRALIADYGQWKDHQPKPRHYSSNQIQLLSHDKNKSRYFGEREKTARVIQKDDYFTRDLFHLRSSPAHQIKVTLDYFSKTESIDKLRDFNNQSYVEANLFEPGLLLTALRKDATFLPHFNAFIQKGLRHLANSEGLLSQESIFFIRLTIYVGWYRA